MKKKLLSLALVLAMTLTLLPTAAFAAATHGEQSCEGTTTKCTGHTGNTYDCTTAEGFYLKDCVYCATCKQYFASEDALTTVLPANECFVAAQKGHEFDKKKGDGKCTHTLKEGVTCTGKCNHPAAESGFSYDEAHKCLTCGAANNVTTHDEKGKDGACSICGKAKTQTAEKKITISQAGFNATATELSLKWSATGLAADAKFSVSLKEKNAVEAIKTESNVAATKGEDGAYSYTMTGLTAPTAKKDYVVTVTSGDVTGTQETSFNPAAHEVETKPSGIPDASAVESEEAATAAVEALKDAGPTNIKNTLASSTEAVADFAALDEAVAEQRNVTVTRSVAASAPAEISFTHAYVAGAAFNASTTNVTVELQIGAPATVRPITAGYQISMTLTNVTNPKNLAVPVVVTLPIPLDVVPSTVTVDHYRDNGSVEHINPTVNEHTGLMFFPVTGFSDFCVKGTPVSSDSGYYGPWNSGSTNTSDGGFYYNVGGGNHKQANGIEAFLPAIASLISGSGVFADVPNTHWAAAEISWARDGGLMSGYGDGNFRPWASTTRQQLWMVLARLAGARPADMAAARQWAINAGVSDGANPEGVLSRQQLVTMLYRFAKSQGVNVSASKSLSGYADGAKAAPYAKEALSWAAAKGIVGGDSKGKLNPEGVATRAHFAVFLNRYCKG